MSRFIPVPRAAHVSQYKAQCNKNNLKYVWYFSLLTIVVFGFHLVHHLRLGLDALSVEMMRYTLIYGFCIFYPALNMLALSKLKDISVLTPVAALIELMFPIFMAAVAVLLSIMGATYGLGITPFAIILMMACFIIQGQVLLLTTVVLASLISLTILLHTMLPAEIASSLIAISFTTSAACIVIAFASERIRIRQFEMVSELNNSNRQLQLLSQQDHLTGLFNRRAIDRILNRELARSERFDHSLSVLMIDIDNFKHINDVYGHVFGDEIIKKVADSIKRHCRDVDYVGRIGGDEFIVMLIETDHNYAVLVADRIRQEASNIRCEHNDVKITISIGHAVSEGEGYIALIEKADKALYQAKKAGKNKVRSLFGIQP